MARDWHIVRAAVEQEILFPSRKSFDNYINDMTRKGQPFEVWDVKDNEDGTVSAFMRKRYNPQNAFLPREG